jgi:predicted phage-related endonuclease
VNPATDAPTIGSSDVPAILGLSAYRGPWDVWAGLVGLVPRYGGADSPAAARGRMLEPAIGGRYAQERGLRVGVDFFPGPQVPDPGYQHPEIAWLRVRPDFLAPGRIVEAKTSRTLDEARGWGPAGSSQIPADYAMQVLAQLAVCSALGLADRCDVAAYGTADDDWRVYEIERRPALEAAILERVGAWYEAHVVARVPPPVDGSDGCGDALGRLYPGRPERTWVDGDATDEATVRAYVEAGRRLRAASARRRELAHAIQARIGDAHGLRVGGREIATWPTVRGSAARTYTRDTIAPHRGGLRVALGEYDGPPDAD